MKNVIVVNSAKKIDQSLFDLFAALSRENYYFFWLAGERGLISQPDGEKIKKSFFGPEPRNFFTTSTFVLLLPALWLWYLFFLYFRKRQEGIAKIICVGNREKFIFTPLAKILGIGVIWLEMPGQSRRRFKKIWQFFSGPAGLITFTPTEAEDLAASGFKKDKIYNISLGVNLQSVERQDNLFSSLAKADKPYSFYKNFSVGAVAEAADRRRLEILLQAVKACLNIIPNFRLVVIGQGPESGNLNWLVKKLGLERRVWLVGEQKNLLQWFDDLDLYIILAENPGLADLERALAAASRGLPLLGLPAQNLSDIIIEGQNGFTSEANSAEALAQKIITIEADDKARKVLGENGRKMVCDHFDRQKQLQRLKEIIG